MSDFRVARRVLRRATPFPIRWRVRAVRRLVADGLGGVRFCAKPGAIDAFSAVIAEYERPLTCYPGQESGFGAKRRNIERALACVDGTIIAPGETFSFWTCVGRPTASAGFEPAAALKGGRLIEEVGGAICLPSTVLYNAGLLAGMAIDERWCHSVDTYGDERYFELGRDAAVEYAYRDLRMRNVWDVPLAVRTLADGDVVRAEIRAREPVDLCVGIVVSPPVLRGGWMTVRTTRSVAARGGEWVDGLGVSTYEVAGGR